MIKFPSWKNLLIAMIFSSKETVVNDARILNAAAKQVYDRGVDKHDIYRLKDLLIAWLYKNNYCVSVVEQTQILPCTSFYHIYGGDWDDTQEEEIFGEERYQCPKCGGSGIYRRTELYTYSFVMDRLTWGWHQPSSQAIIKPVITSKDEKPITETINHSLSDYGDVKQRYWNIWLFLFLKGMIRPSRSWVYSIYMNTFYPRFVYPWRVELRRRIRVRVKEIYNSIKEFFGEIEQPEEELPF